jgi:hypothetical protein
MDERNGTGLPSSLVNGRLEGISVPDLLWNLCHRRSTGVLQLTARGTTKKIYIDGGRIVFAASSDPNDRLGELLLREGVVTLDQLERAIAQLAGGKRLGAILVESGHLSPENLVRGVLSQVKGIVLGLFPWEEGEYAFVEGPLPTAEVVTLGMRTAEILLQGIRQIRSFTRIRKSVGAPSARFRLDADWQSILDGLDIRDGERMLLQRLDSAGDRGATIDAMCREVFLSNYEIYQALWAFRVLGIVHEVDDAHAAATEAAFEGRLDRSGLPELLVRLCRAGETGVLHLTRGTLERTLHLKEGVCVFATSNAIDDGLVAHLLRRGVISLRDREETARRLLSNKRVGTILLEMGVIDESDLRATVREQLSEIVFDTFRWDQGEFVFLGGELPTIEEITLNRGVEDLVFAGVRRVTSWSRVRDGCGGLGSRLVLQPQYLAVLDRMSVGPEEWEMISLLKTPKSIVEICRESVLGDFRSCQILWALRLLGAIGEAQLEASVDAVLTTLDVKPAPAPPATAETAPEPVPEVAAEPEAVVEEPSAAVVTESLTETAPEPAPEPEPERQPIPLSEADETAEIVSEPWRLAAEKGPERPRETSETSLSMVESPDDAPIALNREAVEATPVDPEPEGALPRFELGEPGTGLEDMKVDMRPADAVRDFEMGPPATGLPEDPFDAAHEADEADPAAEVDPAHEAEGIAPDLEQAPGPEPEASLDAALESAPEPDAQRTSRISREEVEAALFDAPASSPAAAEGAIPDPSDARPEAASPAPAEPSAWDPPEGLDGAIAAFNARHVILFRALRTEVGAGAANFVRSCRAALDNGFGELFATTELRADGSWDPEGLRRAVVEHRMGNAEEAFSQLLAHEVDRLRVHLGDQRATAIAGQLAAIS